MNLFIVSDKTAILSIIMTYLKTFIQKPIVIEKQYILKREFWPAIIAMQTNKKSNFMANTTIAKLVQLNLS